MIAHGDEIGRTQQGNNNVYCQDNELVLGRLGPRRRPEAALRVHRRRRPAAPRAPGVPPPPVLRRQRRPRRPERARRHRLVPALRRADGRAAWCDGEARTVMVFLNGEAIPEPDSRGRRVLDDDFLVIFNADHQEDAFTLPERGVRRALGRRDRHRRRRGRHRVARGRQRAEGAAALAHRPAQPARDAAPALRSRHDPPDVRMPQRPPTRSRPRGPHGDLPPAAARGLRLRRGGRARGLPRRARGHAPLPVAGAPGGAGLDARLRRARPHPDLARRPAAREAFERLVDGCREAGLGIVVDVVPNHMTVPEPTHLNAPLWSVLRDGRRSPYAGWFDVDWVAEGERILMPVLGGTVEQALERGDVTLADDGGPTGHEWVLRYYDHEFPVAPGTETLPLPELVDAQAYRLSSWREAGEALNYRRFFDVTSLVAVRVEDPDVFMATHALLARPARARRGRRPPHRPPRRPRRPRRLPRAARRRHRRRLGRRREDPRGRRAAARRLALRRHHRLRRPAAGAAGAHLVGRGRRARPAVGGCRARPGLARRRGRRGQAAGRRRRAGRRGRPADAARPARARPTSTSPRCAGRSRRCSSRWTATAPTSCPAAASTPSRRPSSTARPSGPAGRLAPSDHEALDVVVTLVLGRDLAAGAARQRRPGRRLPGALPADLRAGHGQGHRGHRVLPLVPPRRRQRGGRRPRPPVDLGRRVPRLVPGACVTHLADVDDHAVDPRHQALRGRAGPAHGARRGRRGLGHWLAAARELAAAPPHPRGVDGAHRVPPLADAGRHLADHRRPARGVPPQGGARGQGAHRLGRRRRRRTRTRSSAYAKALFRDPAVQRHLDDWTTAHEPSVRANVLVAEAGPADDARRARRLPGLRDRHAVARRPRQPPPGRLDRPRRAARPGAGRRAGLRPRRREAAGHRPHAGLRRDLPEVFVGEGTTYAGLPTTSEHALAFARGDDDGPRVVTVATRAAGSARRGRRLRRRDGRRCRPGTWHDVLSDDEAVYDGR